MIIKIIHASIVESCNQPVYAIIVSYTRITLIIAFSNINFLKIILYHANVE